MSTVITASLALTTRNLKHERPLTLTVNFTQTTVIVPINILQERDSGQQWWTERTGKRQEEKVNTCW